jgi:hypothetical protein
VSVPAQPPTSPAGSVGPLTDLERYRFDLQGYLVRKATLDEATITELHHGVDRIAAKPGTSITSQRFAGLLEAGGPFLALMDHDAVFDVVRELCGDQVRLDHAYGIAMAPGTSGLDLHGGAQPFDPAQFFVVDDGRIHTGLVAVQWALVDHRPGDGGFACIPGSHRSSFTMPAEVHLDHDLVVEVALDAGDVVLFSEALTHGTLPWRGLVERRSILMKYSPGNSSWAKDPACSPRAMRKMTERQKRLCQPPSVAYHQSVT